MTEFKPNTTPEYPGHLPAKKKSRKLKIAGSVAGGAAVLLLGVGIGSAGSSTTTVTNVDEPKPTVTVTATPEPEVVTETETVTEEVEVTPQACLEYIDLSSEVFTISGEAMGYAGAALDAAINLDVVAMEAAAEGLARSNDDIDKVSDPLITAREECRGAGA